MVCLGMDPRVAGLVGTDESTELWRHELYSQSYSLTDCFVEGFKLE